MPTPTLIVLAAMLLPPDSPAARKPELTPPQTVHALFLALVSGDSAKARPLMYAAGPDEKSLVNAVVKVADSIGRLRVAVDKRFGAGTGSRLTLPNVRLRETEDEVRRAEVSVVGDRATVRLPESDLSFELARTDNVWRVRIAKVSKHAPERIAARALRAALKFDGVTAALEAGRFKSVAEVSQELEFALLPTRDEQLDDSAEGTERRD